MSKFIDDFLLYIKLTPWGFMFYLDSSCIVWLKINDRNLNFPYRCLFTNSKHLLRFEQIWVFQFVTA